MLTCNCSCSLSRPITDEWGWQSDDLAGGTVRHVHGCPEHVEQRAEQEHGGPLARVLHDGRRHRPRCDAWNGRLQQQQLLLLLLLHTINQTSYTPFEFVIPTG